ncbi:TPR repeat-containing protein YfgC precursor [bacterium BMS3Bbin14]|nr:TPR repeat-containing protein YfgC precursor [bacterium BMS3Bbin14]
MELTHIRINPIKTPRLGPLPGGWKYIMHGVKLKHHGRGLVALFLCLVLVAGRMMVGPPAARAMTIGEEREIGQKLLYQIRTRFHLLDDPDISQYMNNLGQEILAVAGPQYFKYHFFVVQSDQFNAFAAPAGLVFFYTGLIETMQNEDELVSVMAHEIGHVVSRHIASGSEKNAKVSAISMALGMASLALGDPALAQGLFTGFVAAGQAVDLHFSREDEEQADRLSFDWMNKLHRNPEAMVDMLKTMRRISRYSMGHIPPYLQTHPNPEARLDYVQSLINLQKARGEKNHYIKTDNFAFLRMKSRVFVAGNDPQKARIYFTNSLASSKNREQSAMATYGLALLEAQGLNFKKALKDMALVRKQYPDRSILEVDTGVMYLNSGDLDRAYILLSQAADRNPDDMYAAINLARVLEKKGEIKAAEQLYDKVARAMPEYAKVYYDLGRIKEKEGMTGTSYFYLGKYYLYEGKIKFAGQYLNQSKDNKSVPAPLRNEAKKLLKQLEKLKLL